MEDVYEKLQKYFQFSKARDIGIDVFEVLFGVFTAGLVAACFAEEHPTKLLVASIILCSIIFVALVITRLIKAAYFPITAIDYLETKQQSKNLQQELDRRKTIDGYIDKAIQSLNNNTCPLTDEDYNYLCENPLAEGLRTVLDSIIQTPQYLLDCNKSKFTVAAHFAFYPEKVFTDASKKAFTLEQISKTEVFRDDFKLSGLLTDDILEDLYAEGLKFQIHTLGLNSFNHIKLAQGIVAEGENRFKLIASPIPAVCEGGRAGVLFIFCEDCICPPVDLDNILLIFGRIVANWISKYKDCVISRMKDKEEVLHNTSIQTPHEIDSSIKN